MAVVTCCRELAVQTRSGAPGASATNSKEYFRPLVKSAANPALKVLTRGPSNTESSNTTERAASTAAGWGATSRLPAGVVN
jgi:hypothetical protein